MQIDLLQGNITRSLLVFSAPMIAGNLLQQLYNIADTLIVGRFLGSGPLAAVGSSFTLIVFLTSMILGLCMGSSTLLSMFWGAKQFDPFQCAQAFSLLFIGSLTLLITAGGLLFTDPIMRLLHIPPEIFMETKVYLRIIFCGMPLTFLFNYFAATLRAIGNSAAPLFFLSFASLLNIVLDFLFILLLHMGVSGAALATVASQAMSAVGLSFYCFWRQPYLRLKKRHFSLCASVWKRVAYFSLLTAMQQSIMNFGILLIQGLVNSFGVAVMAAFAAAVKIDAFAYMPVQDFGNAFSTFIAQNFGAGDHKRIQQGIHLALVVSMSFCIVISVLVCLFARTLIGMFIHPEETEILSIGVTYLRIEGAFYCGIGCLFLLYGFYRGIGQPGISILLTVISLGTRVILAYCLAPTAMGLLGIWWAIPIGWGLADLIGILYYRQLYVKSLPPSA